MTRLLSILIALLCLSSSARSQQASLMHNPNTGQVPGDLIFIGNNTFNRDLLIGNVTWTPAQDGILTITVNGTASEVVGSRVDLPDGNSVELTFQNPNFFWSDDNYSGFLGAGNFLVGTTAADVAAGLRSWLETYAFESPINPVPTISGNGIMVVITYANRRVPSGWATSNSTLLPIETTQNGSSGECVGTMAALRLYNPDNGKLYRLHITGSPNPILTLSEVTE